MAPNDCGSRLRLTRYSASHVFARLRVGLRLNTIFPVLADQNVNLGKSMNTHATRIEVIGDLLHHAADAHPDRRFVQMGDHVATYADVEERSDRLCGGLQSLGVRKGDRIAVILPNCMEYIDIIFAIAKLGAIGDLRAQQERCAFAPRHLFWRRFANQPAALAQNLHYVATGKWIDANGACI